jgi:putative toxin-antitoxin system antitoxin component (TIGR02293 family)
MCIEYMLPVGIRPKSATDLVKRIKEGFSLNCIRALKKKGLTAAEISGCIISTRVLSRRQESGKKLTSRESDCVVRVARILDMADKVFGSHEKALIWLREANEQLHGKKPLQFLCNEYGGRAVEHVMYEIQRRLLKTSEPLAKRGSSSARRAS